MKSYSDNSIDASGPSHPIERLRKGKLGSFFRPNQLESAGLTRDQLRTLIRSKNIDRIGRGLYRMADVEPTENYSLAMACARVPKSIVCLLSALRVHDIGTQSPRAVWIAIPHKSRRPRLPDLRLNIVRFSGKAWTFGVQDVEFEGVPARITGLARTIVDCFRFERLVGPETALEALLDALRRRKVTIAELSRAEEVFPSRRLRAVLDSRSI